MRKSRQLIELKFFCTLHGFSSEAEELATLLLKAGKHLEYLPANRDSSPTIWVAPKEGACPELGLTRHCVRYFAPNSMKVVKTCRVAKAKKELAV